MRVDVSGFAQKLPLRIAPSPEGRGARFAGRGPSLIASLIALLVPACKPDSATLLPEGKREARHVPVGEGSPAELDRRLGIDTGTPPSAAPEVLDRALREEQVRVVERLLAALPGDDDALVLGGLVHEDQGHTERAVVLWLEAARIDPRRADVFEELGEASEHAEDTKSAEGYFQKAMELDPGREKSRLALARILVDRGAAEEAVRLLLAAPTRTAPLRLSLAQARRQLKDFEGARRHYEEALAFDPSLAEAHYGLSLVWGRLGDPARAGIHRASFDRLRGEEQVSGRRNRAEYDSLEFTRRSVAHSHTDVGRVYRARGQREPAERLWRRAAEIDPRNTESRENLAILCRDTGRGEEALEHFASLVRLRPESGPDFLNLGSMLFRLGRLDAAEEAFRKVVELAPDRGEGHAALSQVLLRSPRKSDEALSAAREAVRLSPLAPHYEILSLAEAQAGHAEEAEAALREAAALDPGNAEYANRLERFRGGR